MELMVLLAMLYATSYACILFVLGVFRWIQKNLDSELLGIQLVFWGLVFVISLSLILSTLADML
jgi:hypothetical protein